LLNDVGVALAVNTNSGKEARTVLERLGVKLLFDLIVSADDVSRPKPDPEGVRMIMRRLGVEPDRTIYVGDSSIDQTTAREAGIAFWAYRDPELEADLHFRDFSGLRESLSPWERIPVN